MILSLREQLQRAKNRPTIALNLDYESLLKRMFGPSRDGVERGPTKTQRKYLESAAKDKAFKGMAGVAKTSAGVGSIILRALFQPNFQGFIGRFDYNKLMGTTAKRFFEMVNRINPELIIDRVSTPPMAVYINQPGGIGVAQIDFVGLKEYPGSYEWHRGFIDESDECEREIVESIKTRCRAPCPPEYNDDYGVDMAFNPPDKEHWIYTACTGKDANDKPIQEPTFTLFEPDYGENDANLPPGYTEDRFKGLTEDELQRLKFGNWGSSNKGEAVFKNSFRTQTHVVEHLSFLDYAPILHFLDFGFQHPACIWAQLDDRMRLRIIGDYLGENMEAKEFIMHVKAVTAQRFPLAVGRLYIGDPAAKQKKDTGSTLQILEEQGVKLMYLDGMSIEEGLRRVRFLLQQAPGGLPAVMVDRSKAPKTVRMFQGGYYKHKTTHRPVKDGTYDHIADALRYGITNLFDANGTPNGLPDWSSDDQWGGGQKLPESIAYAD